MIYILTEWNGKGSGDSEVFDSSVEAMKERKCKLTYEAAIKKYGKSHFMGSDVKCSQIDVCTSMKARSEGRVKSTKTWY